MSVQWTLDGWCGWPGGMTLDGWPDASTPCTLDGFVIPYPGGGGAGGGGGGNGGHGGGGGHSGGGFHKKRRERAPLIPLHRIVSDLGAPEVYEELSGTDKRDEAASIVRAHARSEAAVPQVAAVDWNALHADAHSTAKLMALWTRHQIEQDDAEFMRLLGD